MEKPTKQIEGGRATLEEIRLRVAGLKASVIGKKEEWENEKTSLANEIVDMAEGNKALAKKTGEYSDPYPGSAYAESGQRIQSDIEQANQNLREIDENRRNEMSEVDSVREDLESQIKNASPENVGDFRQLLDELNEQANQLAAAYASEREKIISRVRELQAAQQSVLKKNQGFLREQEEVSKNPVEFATEAVLTTREESTGNKFGDKKPEIVQAVDREMSNRERVKEAKTELPKMEEYLISVEQTFDSFEKILADSFQKARADFDSIEQDLNGRVQAMVTTQDEIIQKGRNPGFWDRMKNAEFKGSKAETELRGLRSEQSARIRETYSACLEPINSVFNALLRRGVFSNGDPGKNFDEVTFDNHFNPYRLKQWQNFSEENPRVFGELKEKIEQLKKRGEQIGPRRNKIIEQYNNIRKEVDNRSQKLSTKLDEMFASIS